LKHHDDDPFLSLENDVCEYKANGDIIICGDLNARTGIKPDYISDCNDIGDIDNIILSSSNSALDKQGRKNRNNVDKFSNLYGNKLLSLCQSLNLRILNGRTLGDLSGNYTSFQHNGKSVVDYFISDEQIINNIAIMNVSQPTHLSDHAHINCSLKLAVAQKPTSMNHAHMGKLDYKWDKNSGYAFKETLKLPIIKDKLSELSQINNVMDQVNINEYCTKLVDIYNLASKISLKRKRSGKNIKKHTLGFDYDCIQLKKHVLHLGNLVAKYLTNPIIYGKFLTEKNNLKSLLKPRKMKQKKKCLMILYTLRKKIQKNFGSW